MAGSFRATFHPLAPLERLTTRLAFLTIASQPVTRAWQMGPNQLKELLQSISEGTRSVEEGMEALRELPFADLGYAKFDTHRNLRRGFPETILAQGKSPEHLEGIVRKAAETGNNIIITRTSEQQRKALSAAFPDLDLREFPPSSVMVIAQEKPIRRGRGKLAVVSAGTSDIPVAKEAIETARWMGNDVVELFDVGVAGLQRVLAHLEALRSCEVVIVVAGMDGALPSVLAGLLDTPIIAVPTSVGYGTNFGGIAPLLSMLNSCASGVTVVNIDNGFGAAISASLMNRKGDAHNHG